MRAACHAARGDAILVTRGSYDSSRPAHICERSYAQTWWFAQKLGGLRRNSKGCVETPRDVGSSVSVDPVSSLGRLTLLSTARWNGP
jgi:hypothetical protein